MVSVCFRVWGLGCFFSPSLFFLLLFCLKKNEYKGEEERRKKNPFMGLLKRYHLEKRRMALWLCGFVPRARFFTGVSHVEGNDKYASSHSWSLPVAHKLLTLVALRMTSDWRNLVGKLGNK